MKYLFNKDVLFEDIPYLLAMNFSGYDDGMSYNFWQYKTFSEEEARKHYEQSEEIAPMQEPSEWQARVDENIGLLTDMVKKHPETEFYFFLPPYSELWWDSVYRSGQTEEYLYARQAKINVQPFLCLRENHRFLRNLFCRKRLCKIALPDKPQTGKPDFVRSQQNIANPGRIYARISFLINICHDHTLKMFGNYLV